MGRFYVALWLRWAATFVFVAVAGALLFTTAATFGIYAWKGFAPLGEETYAALTILWLFWLKIGYGVGMIAALTFALKGVCRRCIGGYRLSVLDCRGEIPESLSSKLYFKIWRKWFFGIIWVNAAEAVVLMVLHRLLAGEGIWIGWFSPLWLTPMIIVSGFFAFPILLGRSKQLKVESCTS